MRWVVGLTVSLVLAVPAAAAPRVMERAELFVQSAPVAAPDGTFVAYLTGPRRLKARHDDDDGTTLRVPAGCTPAAASPRRIALDCPDGALVIDGRTNERTTIPGAAVRGLGRRWLWLEGRLVHLETREEIDLAADPFGADHVLDLDRERPARPLCAGAQRAAATGPEAFLPAWMTGGWAVTVGVDGFALARCATGRRTVIAGTSPVLGATHLAYVDRNSTGRERVVLMRLAPRRVRRFVMQLVLDRGPLIALSRGTLWVVNDAGELLREPL